MKEMKHPNIVGYKECFEDLPLNLLNFAVQQPNGRNKAKHFYIVMTYADGLCCVCASVFVSPVK